MFIVNWFPQKPACLFAVALLLALAHPALALETYPSKEGSYSINFPVIPKETVQEIGPNRLIARAVRAGNVIYVAAHGDFVEAMNPDVEMNANIENYTREIHASVVSRAPVTIPRGVKTLSGIEFAYDGEQQGGRGIVVVDGTSSYLMAASSVKPAREETAVSAFLNSFRLLPKQ